MNYSLKETYNATFESFMEISFQSACDQSTTASWSGSGCSVELFPNGEYRVLWDNQIGNRYNSPGIILPVPALGDDEWDDDPDIRFYENAEEAMRDIFSQAMQDLEDYQRVGI